MLSLAWHINSFMNWPSSNAALILCSSYPSTHPSTLQRLEYLIFFRHAMYFHVFVSLDTLLLLLKMLFLSFSARQMLILSIACEFNYEIIYTC